MQRVLALEAENAELRARLADAESGARQAVAETHARYRRDLVPVQQSIVLYQGRRHR